MNPFTRVGAFVPREEHDHDVRQDIPVFPRWGIRNLWAVLTSFHDRVWQTWPSRGPEDLDDDVKARLTENRFEPSHRGLYYVTGKPCHNGAFHDNGIVVPLHRLCEQADTCERLVILRYLTFLMAHSDAYVVWTPRLTAGPWPPTSEQIHFDQSSDLVPLYLQHRRAERVGVVLHHAQLLVFGDAKSRRSGQDVRSTSYAYSQSRPASSSGQS